VIHHDTGCGTSRNVLAILRDVGYAPTVIEYLQTGWTRPQFLALFAAADLTLQSAFRTTKSPADELGRLDPKVPDEVLLEHMLQHPIMVNRPIVVYKNGVRLCRLSGAVLDLIETWPQGP